MGLEIIPLLTGYILLDKGFYATQGQDLGKNILVPATSWYIRGAKEKVLVDTGMCDTKRANEWHHHSYQLDEHVIENQLGRKVSLKPEEIDIVIFTHLHWDHCSNMKKFKNATFIVNKTELDFAQNPLPPYYKSYEFPELGITPPFSGVGFETIQGEEEIVPRIRAFPTPGHSPGHQSVAIETEKGVYTIAGGAAFVFENVDTENNGQDIVPIGRFVDFFDMWESLKKISRISDFVLPSHEIRVFDQGKYP